MCRCCELRCVLPPLPSRILTTHLCKKYCFYHPVLQMRKLRVWGLRCGTCSRSHSWRMEVSGSFQSLYKPCTLLPRPLFQAWNSGRTAPSSDSLLSSRGRRKETMICAQLLWYSCGKCWRARSRVCTEEPGWVWGSGGLP